MAVAEALKRDLFSVSKYYIHYLIISRQIQGNIDFLCFSVLFSSRQSYANKVFCCFKGGMTSWNLKIPRSHPKTMHID